MLHPNSMLGAVLSLLWPSWSMAVVAVDTCSGNAGSKACKWWQNVAQTSNDQL